MMHFSPGLLTGKNGSDFQFCNIDSQEIQMYKLFCNRSLHGESGGSGLFPLIPRSSSSCFLIPPVSDRSTYDPADDMGQLGNVVKENVVDQSRYQRSNQNC